jgi:hypothetical protein
MKDYKHLQNKKIRFLHVLATKEHDKPEDVVVAGIAREKGIVLVHIDRPWDIAFCLTPGSRDYEDQFNLCCEAIELGFLDGVEIIAKQLGISTEAVRRYYLNKQLSGDKLLCSSQDELHEACPF